MNRSLSYFTLGLLAVAYLAIVLLATWDRPEATALGGLLLGGALVIISISPGLKQLGSIDLLDYLVFGFCSYILWRAYSSPVPMYGRSDMFLSLLVGGVWLLRPLASTNLNLVKALWAVLMFVTLIGNLGASGYQLFVNDQWGLFIRRSDVASAHISGFFSHYNYMASFCSLAAFSSLPGVLSKKVSRAWRFLSGVTLIGNIVLLFLSHSRGAFIAFSVGSIVFAGLSLLVSKKNIYLAGRVKSLRVPIVVFSCVMGALLWVSHLGKVRGWFTAGNNLADNGRGEWSSLAVDQFLQAPLIGDGARSYEWRSIELWPDDLWQGTATLDYVHQEYLQLLAEYGIIGFALFILCLVAVLSRQLVSLAIAYREQTNPTWIIASVSAMLAFSVQAFFSFTAHIPALLVSVTAVSVLGLNTREASGQMKFLSLLRRGLLIVAGSAMMILSFNEWPAFCLYTQSNETFKIDYTQNREKLYRDINDLSVVVRDAPNHQRQERLGVMTAKAYKISKDEGDRRLYLTQSIESYRQAVALYPKSPMLRLNYGRVLSWAGNYDDAEEQFNSSINIGEKREYWTNAHWHYAEHCYARGEELWFERKTGEAYYYFLKSQKLLEKAIGYRFSKDMPKLLKQRIELLESAGFVPVDPSKNIHK